MFVIWKERLVKTISERGWRGEDSGAIRGRLWERGSSGSGAEAGLAGYGSSQTIKRCGHMWGIRWPNLTASEAKW